MSNMWMENCITLICCTAIVLGLYAMGAGGWSFLGLLLLGNINYVKSRK